MVATIRACWKTIALAVGLPRRRSLREIHAGGDPVRKTSAPRLDAGRGQRDREAVAWTGVVSAHTMMPVR